MPGVTAGPMRVGRPQTSHLVTLRHMHMLIGMHMCAHILHTHMYTHAQACAHTCQGRLPPTLYHSFQLVEVLADLVGFYWFVQNRCCRHTAPLATGKLKIASLRSHCHSKGSACSTGKSLFREDTCCSTSRLDRLLELALETHFLLRNPNLES